MERLEARLGELARARTARCWASTRARRSPPAASACARCWCSSPPGRRRATTTACCGPRSRSSWSTRRRSSTTTCSTPRRCAAGARPSSPPPAARSPPPPATCCSRARSPSWPRNGQRRRRSACSPTRRPRSPQGELLQRADAWDVGVDARALPARAATSRPRGCSRRRAGSARSRAAAPDELLGDFGRRIGLAFQLLDDVLDVSGPAERTGKHRGTDLLDGTVTLPLILARERDRSSRALDLRAVRTPEQAEAVCDAIAATGALEAARARRWRWSPRRRRTCRSCRTAQQRGAGAGGRRRRGPLR